MIVALADTHGTDGHRLNDRTLEAVRAADLVVHAGDLTTEAVLDAFAAECREFAAVHGNNAASAVRDRLPAERVVKFEGVRIALTHGDDRDDTELGLFGRQERADVVVSGHSHRPEVDDTGAVTLLNPGSHADPRWNRPAYAELGIDASAKPLDGRLRDPDGTVFEEFRVQM